MQVKIIDDGRTGVTLNAPAIVMVGAYKYFPPSLSYHLSLRSVKEYDYLFLSGRLRQVLLK